MPDRGRVTFVLHTHLPYCRLAGRWPHGEEWLHEATLECYLPLLSAFRRLARDIQGSLGVTINITPILAEQLRDPLIVEHFLTYARDRVSRAQADVVRLGSHPLRSATATFHRDRYADLLRLYENDLSSDILAGFRELESSGHIEVATSAATHGYLPLLDDPDAVRFQVETGIASHIRNFGRAPRSFWLPECAYKPGLESYLQDAGVRVFFAETHLVTGGETRGKAAGDAVGPYSPPTEPAAHFAPGPGTTFQPYLVGKSNVAVLARNERTGKQVWSAAHGYPGDGAYREFHKKDDVSGLHYWRVTSREAGLGDKAEYDPRKASEVASGHAAHYQSVIKDELAAYHGRRPGVVLAAYDTELFGHWWLEGVDFLEQAIRGLATHPGVDLTTAGDLVTSDPPSETIELPEGSWGSGGDHRTWLNHETAWTWPEIHHRQKRAAALLTVDTPVTRQLARELLLLQSSDWQFLITTRQADEYATNRFKDHCARFDELAAAIEGSRPEAGAIAERLQMLDNPFPDIRPRAYAAGQPALP